MFNPDVYESEEYKKYDRMNKLSYSANHFRGSIEEAEKILNPEQLSAYKEFLSLGGVDEHRRLAGVVYSPNNIADAKAREAAEAKAAADAKAAEYQQQINEETAKAMQANQIPGQGVSDDSFIKALQFLNDKQNGITQFASVMSDAQRYSTELKHKG